MNAPSRDIASIIEAYGESSGFGLNYAEEIFIGHEPSSPINAVTIYDTPGFPPALGLTDQGYEYPSVMIRVRNKSYQTGMSLAQDIVNALHGNSNITVDGALYTVIYSTGSPALLDWDDNGNPIIVVNFNLQRRAV